MKSAMGEFCPLNFLFSHKGLLDLLIYSIFIVPYLLVSKKPQCSENSEVVLYYKKQI